MGNMISSLFRLNFTSTSSMARTSVRALGLMLLVVLGFLCLPAFGVERFPPPDFDAGYTMPEPTTPAPSANWLGYLDVLVLVGTLLTATYYVLIERSRRWIFAISIFSMAYFGFYRKGCVCSVGSTQDVVLALFNPSYAVPLTVLAFFFLPLIFALIVGRVFCAGVCPLGAIQDVFLIKPIKIPPWLQHALGVVPFIYLGLAVLFAATGSAFIICQYDPFVSLYRMSGSTFMLGLGVGFVILSMFVGRPYCRFLCPYGALLSLLSRFSRWNVQLSPKDCLQCQLCEVACPYGAIRESNTQSPRRTKTAIILAFTVIPLMIILGAWLGQHLSVPLSKVHPTVQLAERVVAEDAGKFTEPTNASTAFRQTGRPVDELVAEALAIRQHFGLGAILLGGFVGLILGVRMVTPWLPVRHEVYEPDHAQCVSCGRCYTYCPREIARIKKLQTRKSAPLTPA